MLANLLSLVLLVGLTATTLLLCLEKWGVLAAWEVKRPEWLMRRCDFCAGYWLSVALLLGVAAVGAGLALAPWWVLGLAFPLALPAAAVSRVLFGLSTGR